MLSESSKSASIKKMPNQKPHQRMTSERFRDHLKEKISEEKMKWRDFPTVLVAENRDVYVNEEEDLQNALFEPQNIKKRKIEKLKFKSYGDWALSVRKLPSEFFENRESLDRFILERRHEQSDSQMIEKLSLEEALAKISVEIGVNIEWYKTHREEMEKDCDEQIDQDELEYFLGGLCKENLYFLLWETHLFCLKNDELVRYTANFVMSLFEHFC